MARKEHKWHYIYKITCLKNSRYYIGMHSTSNLEDGYFGGGKRIKNSVKKHGKELHYKEILEFLDNRELLKNREIELVNRELLNDPLCINLQLGGGGGLVNEEHMKLFSLTGNNKTKWLRKNDLEWANREKNRGKKIAENLWKNNIYSDKMKKVLQKAFLNKKHTKESKILIGKKMSEIQKGTKNSQSGTCWILNNSLCINKKIKLDELDLWTNLGWIKGMKMEYHKK